jgi:hypothetical protein
VARAELQTTLSALPPGSVAALDFPFGVPGEFVRSWRPGAAAMPELWRAAGGMELEEFLEIRDRFVARRGEPLRRGDLNGAEAMSRLGKWWPHRPEVISGYLRCVSKARISWLARLRRVSWSQAVGVLYVATKPLAALPDMA